MPSNPRANPRRAIGTEAYGEDAFGAPAGKNELLVRSQQGRYLKNIKKLTQQSMQAQADSLEKTHEARKKASITLAKVIIAALP
jgi:hypothetical protein